MGICKICGNVYERLEIANSICQNCATPENIAQAKNENNNELENNIGFLWWQITGWLNLTFGNLYILLNSQNLPLTLTTIVTLTISILIQTILSIFILRYNKYVFLLVTILSLNPIIWIINGIYLKNRWNHPKVNKSRTD